MRELTERQKAALEVFLAGGDVKAAAQAVGVTPATIRTWLKQPAFQQALMEASVKASTDLSLMALRAAGGLAKGLRVPGDGEREAKP
jgi:transposase-like protein